MTLESESPRQAMMRLCSGFLLERALYAVTKLKVADHLENGTKTAKELAELVSVDAGVLHRLMRAVAGMGVFHHDRDNAFSLTPLGELLRSDADGSIRNYVLFYHEFTYRSMGEIMGCLETGQSGFELAFGRPFFEYTEENLDLAERFNTMIEENSRSIVPALMEACDFSNCSRIVDVGGGTGALLSSILTAHENLSGVLFDVPSAVQAAQEGAGGPLPRCEFVTGDFFNDDIPTGDTIVLKSILHDWDDERALRILKNCRKTSKPGTRFIVIERLVGPPNQLGLSHYYDLNVMIMFTAQERTEGEYSALLDRAGIRLESTIPTRSAFHVMEAVAK